MTRFHFNLRDDLDAIDEDGEELPDTAAARHRAERYAIEMAAASVLERRKVNLHHRIEVTDESGTIVLTVEFGDVLTIEG